MALSLNDLNKKTKQTKQNDIGQKKKLRPWENQWDLNEIQTRTFSAQEAVKKANEIVRKNEFMSERLQERVDELKLVAPDFETKIEKDNCEFQHIEIDEIRPIIQQQNTFFSVLKNLFT